MIRAYYVLRLVLLFLYELVWSSFQVAWDVITFRHHARPGILALPLDVKTDWEITVFSNLVCMTPGTLSLDVSADRKTLYIHVMFVHDVEHVKQRMKDTLERRVVEAMR